MIYLTSQKSTRQATVYSAAVGLENIDYCSVVLRSFGDSNDLISCNPCELWNANGNILPKWE